MQSYEDLCCEILNFGEWHENRTGIRTKRSIGHHLKFWDIENDFPMVTTKKVAWKACFAEMLSFWKGYDNAANFAEEGCPWWEANANENETWLANEFRKGINDLGRIYGVQWRRWKDGNALPTDQLFTAYQKINARTDDRRLIVSAWNVGDLHRMALPPCHVLFQFAILDDRLDLSMYQRSADVALGLPMNIAGYGWMLCVMAHITNLQAGNLNIYIHDAHVYEDHIENLQKQTEQLTYPYPKFSINPRIETFFDIEKAKRDDFKLLGYRHGPAVNYEMAV